MTISKTFLKFFSGPSSTNINLYRKVALRKMKYINSPDLSIILRGSLDGNVFLKNSKISYSRMAD